MEDNGNKIHVFIEDNDNNKTILLLVYYYTILLTLLYPKLFGFHLCAVEHSIAAILRVRISVSSVFRQLGAYYAPQA
jgi:hypothetical protein